MNPAIMATILHKQMIEQMTFAMNGGKMVQKKVYKLNSEKAICTVGLLLVLE